MFDAKFIQGLQFMGHTTAEAVRALRPGGFLDRLGVRTHCLSCGGDVAESVRWFYLCDMKCKCGGSFEVRPLLELTAWAETRGTTDAHFPASVFRIQEDGKHED
jgi:hypothetical protein